jgi:hypothetical protein
VPPDAEDVLLIVDKRNLRKAQADLKTLLRRGGRVRVACADSGSPGLAAMLGDVTRFELFR